MNSTQLKTLCDKAAADIIIGLDHYIDEEWLAEKIRQAFLPDEESKEEAPMSQTPTKGPEPEKTKPWTWSGESTDYGCSYTHLCRGDGTSVIDLTDDYPGYAECGQDLRMNIDPADAAIITEAGTIFDETKQTPRHILESREALRAALADICQRDKESVKQLARMFSDYRPSPEVQASMDRANAALTLAKEGGQA